MQFPDKYDFTKEEKKWQQKWRESGVYEWLDDKPRDQTFVIDTPPPTVSGILHMGHVFSYTQADFIARYKRMQGFDVFYPMGFDDNGLPTERLVEKVKKVRPQEVGREKFIEICGEVVTEAEKEFEELFTSIALSVDWNQKYETISEESRKISQLSFLDLYNKGEVYRQYQPMLWDWIDQTAIAQAEVEDKELPGIQIYIEFGLMDEAEWDKLKGNNNPRPSFASLQKVQVMTTRPELLGACVALMSHPSNEAKLKGKVAVSPLFNVVVPICFDEKVDLEKGSGFVMCCSWGDDTDKEWIRKYDLAWRPLVGLDGKLNLAENSENGVIFAAGKDGKNGSSAITNSNAFDVKKTSEVFTGLIGKKLVRDIKAPTSAKGAVIKLLEDANLLVPTGEKQEKIIHKTQIVKCAERSGAPIEIIPTFQWFVKLVDKKEQLKEKINECNWFPDYMKVRAEQWNDSLNQDWCISRQRYFGVPFPVWYGHKLSDIISLDKWFGETFVADISQLPINPMNPKMLPKGFKFVQNNQGREKQMEKLGYPASKIEEQKILIAEKQDTGEIYYLKPDFDVMDTWATSSVSPQLSSKGINRYAATAPTVAPEQGWDEPRERSAGSSSPEFASANTKGIQNGAASMGSPRIASNSGNDMVLNQNRHAKLFPADMRPQAHEIIRTWAYYTIAKALLHENTVPWKNLVISGWCLAEDKSKMSKSKGNVVTPVPMVQAKSADVVRYWTSTSSLGADTAYSEKVLDVGKKLINKLWNVSKFASVNLGKLKDDAKPTEAADIWILSKLNKVIASATASFEQFEYSRARQTIEDFFWKDFCDNYLEICKARSYGETCGEAMQQSALITIKTCVDRLLRLWAPFVPHITEELNAIIFGDVPLPKGGDRGGFLTQGTEQANNPPPAPPSGRGVPSIHRRGNWPKADLVQDEGAEKLGDELVRILEEVRKFKSEKGVSIKFPVANLKVATEFDLAGVEYDLKSVTSSEKLEAGKGEFAVEVTLGEQAAA